ncbi:allantoicase [Streptomyces sp. 4503]|uniref:Probable allantoicase n=1 Tax=Streptomyces niphimycinicus TaxID=2842201 RepID=A0ABS6C976_9ACTN|nr:allantoicase [Streptomyces niphimycinicus]MBU3863451.1 allantoicase [Streptomyces niphimycinicus]
MSDFTQLPDFTRLPDLTARALGGGVVAANDEFFAEKENLLRPTAPVFQPHTFGHKGQIMDGWETRRRRPEYEAGDHDWAVVRLGAPGVIRGVVVDTAHFTGNYPESCSLDACAVEGYPAPAELEEAAWVPIVAPSPLNGDTRHLFEVESDRRFTHVRLNIHPDGGVARLRVHGDVVPDPRFLAGSAWDLGAVENGGRVVDASDRFYSPPNNVLSPGLPRVMGDGWETRRRRGGGNDWMIVELAVRGHLTQAAVDTSYFIGNSPGSARLRGIDATVADPDDPGAWFDLLPRTRLQRDTRHRFRIGASRPVSHVKLDIYPDGGLARLQLFGEPTPAGLAALGLRWFDLLPAAQAVQVLVTECGATPERARDIVDRRPLTDPDGLAKALEECEPFVADRVRGLVATAP